jgi:glyoxylase-like metal-dependent hydrolase (beta-lactamase superfamily II)
VTPAEITPGVYVTMSPVYLTTTTIVVGRAGGCLLIDPALAPGELAVLGEWLASRGLHPVAGWATHAHWDHVLWARCLGASVPRYATAGAVAACTRDRSVLIAEMSAEAPGHELGLFGLLEVVPSGGRIPWDGPAAVVITHDGHAPGHGAVFLPAAGVLVAGDMLSDVEIPLLDAAGDDPFGQYRAGLARLASVPGVQFVVPGHGHVGDAAAFRARVAADFGYLDAVEAARTAGPGAAGAALDVLAAADPRLASAGDGWLAAEHASQLAIARQG